MSNKYRDRLLYLIEYFHRGKKKGLADTIGVATASISDWTKENPKCSLSSKNIEKICNAYNVSEAWLRGLEPIENIAKKKPSAPELKEQEHQLKEQEHQLKEQEHQLKEQEHQSDDDIGPMSLRDKLIEARTEARILRETLNKDIQYIKESIKNFNTKTDDYFNKTIFNIDKIVDILKQQHCKTSQRSEDSDKRNIGIRLKIPDNASH